MFMKFVNEITAYLAENPALVALIISIMEYVKRWVLKLPWFRPEYLTAVAFLLGFLLAIPASGFVGIVWLSYCAHGFGLGLVATGIYKVGTSLARTAISG